MMRGYVAKGFLHDDLLCLGFAYFSTNTKQNYISFYVIWVEFSIFLFKEAQSYLFNSFSNFWRFWYHKKAHIFLIIHGKFNSWKVFLHLEDINENESGYGNHLIKLTQ